MVLVNNDNVVWNGDSEITEEERRYMSHVRLIMHELCHQQQRWYTNKFYHTHDLANRGEYQHWRDTQAGQDLIESAGYVQDAEGDWVIPMGSPYRNGGYHTPKELSASVCAGYLIEKVYESDYPTARRSAVPKRWLTPEMREWVQEWMLVDF